MAKLTLVTFTLLLGISTLSLTQSEYAAPQQAAAGSTSLGQYLLYKKCCTTFNWIENRQPRRIGSEFLGKRSDQPYSGSWQNTAMENDENFISTLAARLCHKLIPTPLLSYYIHAFCWESQSAADELDDEPNSMKDIALNKRFSQTIPLSGKRFKLDPNARVRGLGSEFLGKRARIGSEFLGKRARIGSEFLGKRARIGSEFLGKRYDRDLMKEPVDNTEKTRVETSP